MPPAFRNHRAPTACGTEAAAPASSLDRPIAMAAQNFPCWSRLATGGRPGEGNGTRPDRSDLRFPRFIAPPVMVLRRPLESAVNLLVQVMSETAEGQPSNSRAALETRLTILEDLERDCERALTLVTQTPAKEGRRGSDWTDAHITLMVEVAERLG